MKEVRILFTILVAIVVLAWVVANYGLIDLYESFQRNGNDGQDYLQIFNDYRIENQCEPLLIDARLNELARQRCLEISQPNSLDHEGIKKYNLGENIAMLARSWDSDYKLLKLWVSSPRHRANILDERYARTGFARDGKYAVQLFASR